MSRQKFTFPTGLNDTYNSSIFVLLFKSLKCKAINMLIKMKKIQISEQLLSAEHQI